MELNTPNKYVHIIPNILGNAWIEKELDEYCSFRHSWSPKTRWYHRRPTVSPIVPILYWSIRDTYRDFEEPFGYWGGYPVEVLNRLGEEIDSFRYFWEALPDDRGIKNLKWALTSPQRFFSFSHELTTSHFLASRLGVYVEPLFLDPKSTRGKPDFIVKTPQREFAVQCKSEDPSAATQMPYDLFQYFAGIFQRLVEDSGKSYHLTLILKKQINLEYMNRIRNRVENLIKQGITVPYTWNTTYADIELTEIGSKLGAQPIEQIRRRLRSLRSDPLYDEFVPIIDNVPTTDARRGSVLFVSGRRGKELDQVIRSAVMMSIKEAPTTLPLIVAVHLYQDIELNEFWNRSSVQQQFKPWTDQFFKENPQVAMIYLSSNHELYLTHAVNKSQVGIKHGRQGFVLESPEWDHNDVKDLGI